MRSAEDTDLVFSLFLDTFERREGDLHRSMRVSGERVRGGGEGAVAPSLPPLLRARNRGSGGGAPPAFYATGGSWEVSPLCVVKTVKSGTKTIEVPLMPLNRH